VQLTLLEALGVACGGTVQRCGWWACVCGWCPARLRSQPLGLW